MPVFLVMSFHPLRMVLKRRSPVELDLMIRNPSKDKKKITVKVFLSPDLSFSKGGFKAMQTIKIDELKSNESKRIFLDIYPKPRIEPGEHPIEVLVEEHHLNYNTIKNQKKFKEFLRVE